jgi:hypothetical protein
MAGKPSASGSKPVNELAWSALGLMVVTIPGSAASENDQPPPTARSGSIEASASLTAALISSTEVGKHMVPAT